MLPILGHCLGRRLREACNSEHLLFHSLHSGWRHEGTFPALSSTSTRDLCPTILTGDPGIVPTHAFHIPSIPFNTRQRDPPFREILTVKVVGTFQGRLTRMAVKGPISRTPRQIPP